MALRLCCICFIEKEIQKQKFLIQGKSEPTSRCYIQRRWMNIFEWVVFFEQRARYVEPLITQTSQIWDFPLPSLQWPPHRSCSGKKRSRALAFINRRVRNVFRICVTILITTARWCSIANSRTTFIINANKMSIGKEGDLICLTVKENASNAAHYQQVQ